MPVAASTSASTPNALSATAAAWLGNSANPSICSTVPVPYSGSDGIERRNRLPHRGRRFCPDGSADFTATIVVALYRCRIGSKTTGFARFGERLVLAVFDDADDLGRVAEAPAPVEMSPDRIARPHDLQRERAIDDRHARRALRVAPLDVASELAADAERVEKPRAKSRNVALIGPPTP